MSLIEMEVDTSHHRSLNRSAKSQPLSIHELPEIVFSLLSFQPSTEKKNFAAGDYHSLQFIVNN